MNVEIGAEAALFPEKEYISRIFVAVHDGQASTVTWQLGITRKDAYYCSMTDTNAYDSCMKASNDT
jgi:hypothetical protein